MRAGGSVRAAIALGLAVVALADVSDTLNYCLDADKSWCTLCDGVTGEFRFDMTGLAQQVLTQTYSVPIEPPAIHSYEYSPCGINGSTATGTPPVFNRSLCASGPDESTWRDVCGCNQESSNPNQCIPLGTGTAVAWDRIPEVEGESYGGVRAIYQPPACFSGCSSCRTTIIILCSYATLSNQSRLLSVSDFNGVYCFQPNDDRCNKCFLTLTRDVCLPRPCLNDCSDHGTCSFEGHCECIPPFYGDDCSESPPTCDLTCPTNSTCFLTANNTRAECYCDPGFAVNATNNECDPVPPAQPSPSPRPGRSRNEANFGPDEDAAIGITVLVVLTLLVCGFLLFLLCRTDGGRRLFLRCGCPACCPECCTRRILNGRPAAVVDSHPANASERARLRVAYHSPPSHDDHDADHPRSLGDVELSAPKA